MSGSVRELLAARRSVRLYRDEPVPDELVRELVAAGMRAPTSDNLQAYSIISISKGQVRDELAQLSGGQRHVAAAPVFLAVCADLHRLNGACTAHGETLDRTLEIELVAVLDAGLVGMAISLAAEDARLGTVMIGGMRNEPEAVAALLGLPEGVFVAFGLCMGWPAKQPPQKPRLPIEAVFFQDRYDAEASERALESHDRALAEHYRSRQSPTADESWTKRIASEFRSGHSRRRDLRRALEARGFSFR